MEKLRQLQLMTQDGPEEKGRSLLTWLTREHRGRMTMGMTMQVLSVFSESDAISGGSQPLQRPERLLHSKFQMKIQPTVSREMKMVYLFLTIMIS